MRPDVAGFVGGGLRATLSRRQTFSTRAPRAKKDMHTYRSLSLNEAGVMQGLVSFVMELGTRVIRCTNKQVVFL